MPVTEIGSLLEDYPIYGRGIYTQFPKGITVNEITPYSPASAASFTFYHPIVDRSDRILVVMLAATRSGSSVVNDPTVITFNGVGLTKLSSVNQGTTSSDYSGIYYMINPPAGSGTIVITFAITVAIDICVVNFSGVHQVTPFGTPVADAIGANTTHSHNVTTASWYETVISTICTFTVGVKTPTATGQTIFSTSFGSGRGEFSQEPISNGSPTVVTWTYPSSISTMVSVGIKPAS